MKKILIALTLVLCSALISSSSHSYQIKVWTGNVGESFVNKVTYDGRFIYANMDTIPGKLIRIDTKRMRSIKVWTGDGIDSVTFDSIFVDNYIYVATATTIVKLDYPTMTTILPKWSWSGNGAISSLIYNNGYIYALIVDIYTPGKIIKINPSDMSTVSMWEGETGENSPRGFISDGTYLYTSVTTIPNSVLKIDMDTMTPVGRWTGEIGHIYASQMVFDGSYLYVGFTISPAQIVKINPLTMTTMDTWIGNSDQYYASCATFNGYYIYNVLRTSPGTIIKIDPVTMSVVFEWAGVGLGGTSLTNNPSSLIFARGSLYAGFPTHPPTPGVIWKIIDRKR